MFKDRRAKTDEILYMAQLKTCTWMKHKLPNFICSVTGSYV